MVTFPVFATTKVFQELPKGVSYMCMHFLYAYTKRSFIASAYTQLTTTLYWSLQFGHYTPKHITMSEIKTFFSQLVLNYNNNLIQVFKFCPGLRQSINKAALRKRLLWTDDSISRHLKLLPPPTEYVCACAMITNYD